TPTARRSRRTASCSTTAASCAGAALPTATTATRRSAPAGCATRSTRCWPASTSSTRRSATSWAARSSGAGVEPRLLGGQLALEDLARRVARQLVHELDVARHLVAGEVLLDVGLELVDRRLLALGGHDERLQAL